MFILDIPPEPPGEVPVLMMQAGSGFGENVVMRDLESLHEI